MQLQTSTAWATPPRSCDPGTRLGWISRAADAPYFVDETGRAWTPMGHNDSIAWVDLAPLYGRRDVAAVEAKLRDMAAHGVTCLRLMLECAQSRNRYIERPHGRLNLRMVQLWDDLFALCESIGLRVLLTPFDTFWTWMRWAHHPYNRINGGPLESPSRFLLEPQVRSSIKARLTFAVERWGGSGALFAWDLWNEIHPAQAEDSTEVFDDFIHDLSDHVRRLERKSYGRSHLQTVSLFGPELDWRPGLAMGGPIFRHPDLDFATIHIYAKGSIDAPKDTVAPAIAFGAITRRCLAETPSGRPFLDTEHGPIHTFKDKRRTLPEAFDDEMFRHMQWAHLASGGAGGGMRWPNRRVHVLTPGMRRAQKAMSGFLPLIDWTRFRRRNLNEETLTAPGRAVFATFACGDGDQAVTYLLRRDSLAAGGRLDERAKPVEASVRLPGLAPGLYDLVAWNTHAGEAVARWSIRHTAGARGLCFTPPAVATDLAIALRRRLTS